MRLPMNTSLATLKPSGIRRINALAAQHPGCIALALGEPDFPTPDVISAEVTASLNRGDTHYPPNNGRPALREALSAYMGDAGLSFSADEVILTDGATEALSATLMAMLNPGDEVIIPTPAFGLYESIVVANHAKAVFLDTEPAKFQIDEEALRACVTPATKAIVICSPNNPTGDVAPLDFVAALCDACPGMVMIDEAYVEFADDSFGAATTAQGLIAEHPNLVILHTLSKAFGAAGTRLGYVIAAPEVIDRIPSGYSNFVIPFVVGISFMLIWLTVGLIRLLAKIPADDRRRFWKSLITPKIALKNIKDLFCDCLFHTKIWKRKPLLGYMHSSIAFGWFMLIVLGHIEVALFVPKHLAWTDGGLFYPIFYRFFVWINPGHVTLRGWFFFFLMDFFLLYVLTGVGMAIFKRFRSIVLGMRHTTKPSLADRVALYSLWMIFPLRLLAESFTADLSGGSFLTVPVNHLWHWIFGDKLFFMPVWWAYSICLGLFFAAMPFSRYMHILTEVLWILLRNAGIQPRHPRKGVAEAEIYACSSCGLCLDACPMNVRKKNLKYSSVYFIRFLRRHNEKKINAIADKCLMCDKCHALCPVGVDAPALRRAQRATVNNSLPYDYSYLKAAGAGMAAGLAEAPVLAPAESTSDVQRPRVHEPVGRSVCRDGEDACRDFR